jgi:hypothetical protein
MGSVKILLLLGLLAAGLQHSRHLRLYPNGALVPEETQEVQEARQLHEAAMERMNGPHPPTTTRRPRSPSLILPPAPQLVRRIAAGATGGARRPPSPVPRLPAPPSLVRQRGGGRPAARPRTPPAGGRGPPPPAPVQPLPPKRTKFREVNADICKLFVYIQCIVQFLNKKDHKFAK